MLILPIFDYADILLFNINQKDPDILQCLENCVVCYTLKAEPRTAAHMLHDSLDVQSLTKRRMKYTDLVKY